MAIGSRDKHGEWYALAFHHYVSFTAQLSSVCRVTSCFLAPRGLATLAPSRLALLQSM
ncbi:hypothetical protein KB20921_04770 [Edwardsiella ictaluri]|nr:hypothetical protein KH20906_12270 [Edwardsiella ictaluri]BEI01216.1 hypothetical protein KB20921_04770 [Edwardsiella ictaluri]BEI08145.1 hypothetical protein STU22726_04760 [Edwardsiella ictaluri]BEI08924.1 hypothetical protein STU22726_12550 [Edwardsiella ictaluri]BEI09623.1 hypothetical protein STU22726_19540 [Edwardsiella ictaluri]